MILKDEILTVLTDKRNQYVSGEYLADHFHVTRSAIWKIINHLREQGYEISAVRHRGYCLKSDSDILSAVTINDFRSSDFPLDIHVYQTVDSTNEVLKRAALSDHAPEGTVILAEEQTAGKGRKGRSFFSPPKTGVYLSILLRPDFPAKTASLLTIAAAEAAAEAMEETFDISPDIKWVNDLYLKGRKIAGILTEASMSVENNTLDYVIVGIGINLCFPENGFPDELSDIAGAVFSSSDEREDRRNPLIASILDRFFEYYSHIEERGFIEEYRKRLFFLGKKVEVIGSGKKRLVTAIDINDDCHLLVLDEKGNKTELSSGEISIKMIE